MLKIGPDTIKKYANLLDEKSIAKNEQKRRFSSVDKFVRWAHERGYLGHEDFKQSIEVIASKGGERAMSEKSKNTPPPLPFDIKSFGIRHYVGFTLFLLLISLIGAGLYNQFFKRATTPFAYTTPLSAGSRLISFQGRLTDSIGNPIVAPIDITYRFYSTPTGGTPIATATRVCTADPDQDGVFSNMIGSDAGPNCSTELPSSIFTDNTEVWLGLTIGSEVDEMEPRQQIANVGYAINAETLQGLPPGTSEGSIPFISQAGDMLLASANPAVRSTSATANFTISSANATTIQSAGSGDITLSATEGGTLRFKTFNGTLQERMTITPQGTVGINNINPRASLDVIGDASLSGNLAFSGTTTKITQLNGGDISFATSVGGDLTVTERLTLTNLGNVGIGTTVPGYRLDVAGSASASGNISMGGQLQVGRFSANPAAVGAGSVYYNTLTNSLYVYNSTDWVPVGTGTGTGESWWTRALDGVLVPQIAHDSINLGTSATSSATVHLAGKPGDNSFINTGMFGIGTTSPTTMLDVAGSVTISSGQFLGLATEVSARPSYSWTGDTDTGLYHAGSNSLALYTGGSNRLNVASTLTTMYTPVSMASTLRVASNGDIATTLTAGNIGTGAMAVGMSPFDPGLATLQVGGGISAYLLPQGSIEATDTFTVGADTTLASHTADTGQTWSIVAGTQNGGALMRAQTSNGRLDPTANVTDGGVLYALNTTFSSADYEVSTYIDVTDSSDDVAVIAARIQPNGDLYAYRFSSGVSTLLKRDGSTGTYSVLGSSTIYPSTGNTVKLRVVGNIITVYRDNTLLINATDSDITAAGSAGIGAGDIGYITSDDHDTTWSLDDFQVQLYGTSNTIAGLFYGNVGIGTTTANEKLEVSGNASVSGILTIGQNNSIRSSYGPLNLAYKSGLDSWATGLTLQDTTGNVGIGTTSPLYKLDVAGWASVSGNLSAGGQVQVGRFGSLPATSIGAGSLAYNTSDASLYYHNGSTWNQLTTGTNLWQEYLGALSPSISSRDLNVGATATASALVHLPGTINNNAFFNLGTGNLGIGTTAPIEKLDVSGSATISGNLTIAQGSAIRSSYGALNLAYKSGLNAWTNGITLKDGSGFVGLNTANPIAQFQVATPTNTKAASIFAGSDYTVNGTAKTFFPTGDAWYEYPSIVATSPKNQTVDIPSIDSYGTVGIVGASNNNSGNRTSVGIYGYSQLSTANGASGNNAIYGMLGRASLAAAGTGFQGSMYGVYGKADVGSGTVGATPPTLYGGYFTTTGAATTTTYAGYFNASGGTTNYGVYSAAGRNYFNGNVGIGTTTMAEMLNVSGNATMSGTLTIGQNNTLRPAYGPLNLAYKSGPNAWTTGMVLKDGTGYVGIGTVNPSSALSVAGAIDATGNIQTAGYFYGNRLRDYSGGNLLLQDDGGNVGIGTATPNDFTLEVAGNIGPDADGTRDLGSGTRHFNTLYVNNIVGTGALGYWNRGTGVLYPSTASDGLAATSSATTVATFTATGTNNAARIGGSANYLTVASNGNLTFTNSSTASITGPTSGLTIDATTGTLGFGTSNNARTINIGTGTGIDTINLGTGATGADVINIGSANAGALTVRSNAALTLTGSTNSAIDFPNFDAATTGQITTAYANSAALRLSGNGAGITFTGAGANTNTINTSNNNHLSIATGTGNVGIGSATPGQKLDVTGSIRASSQLISTVATGTSPLAVNSTTTVSNLSADYLDGQHSTYFSRSAMSTFQNSIYSLDSRNTNYEPDDRDAGLYADFKANATDGLSDGGTYHGVLTFRSYGTAADLSGGNPIQIGYTANGNLYTRMGTGTTTWGTWYKMWNQNNDGASSGLDADTLDTIDSLSFLRSDTSDSFTSGTLTMDAATTLDVNGNLSVADTDIAFDGASTNFATTGNFSLNTSQIYLDKASGNVGIGTGTPSTFDLEVAGNIGPDADNTRNIGAPGRAYNTIYANNIVGIEALGYWIRSAGILSPYTQNDGLAATSSATTVATFTATGTNNAARIGGSANYLTVASNGTLTFTNSTTASITGPTSGLTIDATTGTLGLGTSNNSRTINIGTGTGVDTINIGTGATGADVINIGSANAGALTVRSNAALTLHGEANSIIDFPNFDVATTGQITTAYANSAAINLTGNAAGITFGGTGNNQITTAGSNHLALMPGGNVGIGTTAPLEKLDVTGNASVSGNVTVGAGNSIRSAYGNLNFGYKSGPNAWATAMTINDNNGFIGLGVTNPESPLQISRSWTNPAGNTNTMNNSTVATYTGSNSNQMRANANYLYLNAASGMTASGVQATYHGALYIQNANQGTISNAYGNYFYTGIDSGAAGSVGNMNVYNAGIFSPGVNTTAFTTWRGYNVDAISAATLNGATVATLVGYDVGALSGGTTNIAYRGQVASGANRYNLYMNGTADNYLEGNTGIGTSSPSTFKLEVAGDIGPDADNTRNIGAPGRAYNTIYANNIVGVEALGYWQRSGGILSPFTQDDGIAATSSATTVATFTATGANDALRTGGSANYIAVSSNGDLTFTGSNADSINKVSGTLNINTVNNQPVTTGNGQITLAGNVDAQNGLDVTTANLTVGGTNFTVAPGTGNITTAGSLTFGGDVALSRGTANQLDLASGDSFNLVSGSILANGTTVLDSSRNLSNIGTIGSTYLNTGASYVDLVNSAELRTGGTVRLSNAGALSNITGYSQASGAFAFSGGGNFSFDSAGMDVTTAGAVSNVTTLSMNNQFTNSYANSAAVNLTGNAAGITFGGAVGNTNTINTSNNNHLYVNTGTGNVGIGSATPTSFKLEVAGDIGPDADGTRDLGSSSRHYDSIYVNNIYGNGSMGYWNRGTGILYPSTLTDGLAATTSATTVATFTATGTNNALRAGGNTNYFAVSSSGNLTFTNSGTASITGPTTGLTIDATTGTLGLGTSNNARTINIGTGTGVDTINIGTGATGADVINIGSANAGALTVRSNAALALYGSTNSLIDFPSFDVGTNGQITSTYANAAALYLNANAAGITFGGTAGNTNSINTSNNNHLNLITGTGNVGIGSASPGQKLDVVGSIRSSSQLISTVATGTSPLAVSSTTVVNNLNSDMVDGFHGTDLAKRAGYSATLTAPAGWYRIATNGPVTDGGTGGDRAAAQFTVRDTQSSRHSSTTFYASVHYGSTPSLTMLNRSYYSTNGCVKKVRIVEGDVYEGAAVEVYVDNGGSNCSVSFTMYDNEQSGGWTAANWTAGSIPTGFATTDLNLDTTDPILAATGNGNADAFYIGRTGNLHMGGNMDILGTISDAGGNLVLDDTVDIGSSANGLRIDAAGLLADINGNIQMNDILEVNVIRDYSGGNLSLQDDAGNVGIGTTSPLSKLEIKGASSTPSGEGIAKISNTTDGMELRLGTDAAGNYSWIQSAERGVSYNDLALQYQGGSVGIGTTDPTYILQVHQNTLQSDIAITTNVNLGSANTTMLTFGSDIDGTPSLASIGQFNTGDLKFSSVGNLVTPDMTIHTSGNIGMGTTNPLYKLDVQGWASASGNLSAGGQFQLGRFASDPTLAIGAGSMYYNTTTNAIYYHDGLNWNEVSGSGSNVWQRISGVLSPIYDGDVIAASSGATTVATFTSLSNVDALRAGGLTSYMSVGYDGTLKLQGGAGLALEQGNISTPFGGFGRFENNITYSEQFDHADWTGYCGTKAFVANTTDVTAPDGTNTAERMNISAAHTCSSDTAWGVAQDAPAGFITTGQTYTVSVWARGASGGEHFRLGVNDTHSTNYTLTNQWKRYTATFTIGPSTIRGLQFFSNTNGAVIYTWGAQLEHQPDAGVYVKTEGSTVSNTNYGLVANSTGNHLFTGGNVGIGVSMPTAKLDVSGTASVSGDLTIGNGTFIKPAYGDLTFAAKNGLNSWTSAMVIQGSNGNVGIGTTAPTQKLTIAGNISFDNTDRHIYRGTQQRISMLASSMVFNESGANVDIRMEGDTDVNAFYLDASSNGIGLGTTLPVEKLDVRGNASASGNLTIGLNSQIRSQYGPLNLAYKSGLNTWTTGMTLDDITGFVGVGTTAPDTLLELASTTTNKLKLTHTDTTAEAVFGVDTNGLLSVVPTGGMYLYADPGQANRSMLAGTRTVNSASSIYGLNFDLHKTGSGGSTGLAVFNYADANSGANIIDGGYLYASVTGAYTAGGVNGLRAVVENTAGATIGNINGVQSRLNGDMGTVTGTVSFFRAYNSIATGTIPTLYGFYADELTQGTDNYAVYTAGATKSYFGGNVGIGTTIPLEALTITGNASMSGSLTIGANNDIKAAYGPLNFAYKNGPNAWTTGLILDDLTGNLGLGTTEPEGKLHVVTQASSPIHKALAILDQYENQDIFTASDSGNTRFVIQKNGNVGIGIGMPANLLSLFGTTAPQLRISYADTEYATMGVGSSGMLTFTTPNETGTYTNNITLTSGISPGNTTTEALTLKSTQTLGSSDELLQIVNNTTNLLTVRGGGFIGIGTLTPAANWPSDKLYINGSFTADKFNDPANNNRYVDPNAASRIEDLELVNALTFIDGSNNGIGTINMNNNSIQIGNSIADSSSDVDICVGDSSCTGKIDAGTIDPPYTINGKRYATYLPAMTGVKEETTGTLTASNAQRTAEGYAYVLDFNNAEEGSDLWLFGKTSNIKSNMAKLSVLLTPSENARTWYKTDPSNGVVIVYSSRPTTISYRLTAPRFNAPEFGNSRPDTASRGWLVNDPDIIKDQYVLTDSGSIHNTYSVSTETATDTTPEGLRRLSATVRYIASGDLFEETGVFADIMIGKMEAGFVESANMLVTNIANLQSAVVGSLTAANARINDALIARLSIEEKIISPVIETGRMETATIAPKSDKLAIDLSRPATSSGDFAKLVIRGLENREVVSIDALGNATFSGSLTAQEASISGALNAHEASISGTLTAREVRAGNIDALSQDIASQSSTLAQLSDTSSRFSTDINAVQQELADLKNRPLPEPQYYQNLSEAAAATVSSLLADSVTTNTLTVNGESNLFAINTQTIKAGGVTILENAIYTVEDELKFSALQRISFFDGMLTIAKDGTITAKSEFIAEGGIRTREIKPLDGSQDVSIRLNTGGVSTDSGKLKIVNDLGAEVASVNASGSARFSSLAFNEIATNSAIIADSGMRTTDNQVIPAIQTNAEAAGTGTLPAGAPEIVIYNKSVTNHSLIYLTPIGETNGAQLTVVKKITEGEPYFSVSAGSAPHNELRFNWLIIN